MIRNNTAQYHEIKQTNNTPDKSINEKQSFIDKNQNYIERTEPHQSLSVIGRFGFDSYPGCVISSI
jgi:hypothetical protein